MSDVQVRFGAQTGELDSALGRIENNFRTMFNGTEAEAKQAAAAVRSEMQKIVESVQSASTGGNNLNSMFGKLKGSLMGLAAGYGLGQLAKSVVTTHVEFEKLRAVLTTLEGDASEARFQSLKKFATETPYDLQQVVGAFTKLKSRGLDPGTEAMRAYGNIASGMGKSLDQFVEAVGDAATGEMERLKEFGITAKQSGDEVKFSFQGQETTVKRSSTEIQNYLRKIGEENFGGAMDNQMKTLAGAFANVGDAAASFADDIGRGGLGQAIADVVDDMMGATEGSENLASELGNGLGVVVTSVWEIVKGFGEGVKSVFNGLGEAMSIFTGNTQNNGNAWMNVWRTALSVISWFATAVRANFIVIGQIIRSVTDTVVAFIRTVNALKNLDLSAAVDTWKQWGAQQKKNVSGAIDSVIGTMETGKKNIDKIWAAPPKENKDAKLPEYVAPKGGGAFGGKSGSGGKGGGKDQMSAWRDELQQKIQDEAGYFKDSTDLEINFWKGKLALVAKGSKDAQQIRNQLFQLEKQKARDELQVQIDALNDKQAAARDNMRVQLQIEDEKLALIGGKYGQESQQYRAALRERERMQRDFNKQMVEIEQERINHSAQLDQIGSDRAYEMSRLAIDAKRQEIEAAADLGSMGSNTRMAELGRLLEEEIALETAHEQNIYQIKLKSLQDKIALMELESPERARMLQELEILEAEHESKMDQMRAQQNMRLTAQQNEVISKAQQKWMSILQPVGQAFEGILQGMMQGTQTFRSLFLSAIGQLASSFISFAVQMGVKWLATQLGMTAVSSAQAGVRASADTTAAISGAAIASVANMGKVMSNAAVAASAAYASTAAIPIVGPAMAPAAAGAAYGATAAFASLAAIPAAAKGFDIPRGTNPLTQLHEEEMVLPANIANPLRSMLANAGPRTSDIYSRANNAAATMRAQDSETNITNEGDVNLSLPSMDPRAGMKYFMNNRRALVKALKKAYREGAKP